jgi:hypothetical protein
MNERMVMLLCSRNRFVGRSLRGEGSRHAHPPALDLFGGAGDNRPRFVSGLTY